MKAAENTGTCSLAGFCHTWRRKGIAMHAALDGGTAAGDRRRSSHGGRKVLLERCGARRDWYGSHVGKTGYQPVRYGLKWCGQTWKTFPIILYRKVSRCAGCCPALRAIWDADSEANRDHWGFIEPSEEDYQAWLVDITTFQPSCGRLPGTLRQTRCGSGADVYDHERTSSMIASGLDRVH